MKYKVLIIFSNIILLLPLLLYAHGVSGKINAGGIMVSAQYDTGEPMSYARVKIIAPGARLIFQSGRTDRNGRFCFFPDTPGDWEVVVDDEMGHRLEVIVPVNEARELKMDQQAGGLAGSSFCRYGKVLMGICIIFGIFGSLLGWRGYKKVKGENSKR